MVTLAFFLIFTLLSILIALFDMKLFEMSFFDTIVTIYFSEIAVGRYISYFALLIGIVSSILIDIRLFRAKKRASLMESDQG